MNLVTQLRNFLEQEKIFSSGEMEKISISLAIGDVPRPNDKLCKRYIVSKDNKPQLSVKFIPPIWEFSVEDILRTQSLYSGLDFVKVPRMLGHFSSDEGHFFIEEHLRSPVALVALVE